MTFQIQPFVVDKSRFGECYNRHCEAAWTDDTWIQLLDYDAMILSPKTYRVIDEAIFRYPDTAIFGAVTNRVAYEYQRASVELDENMDMRYHARKAEAFADQFPDGECEEYIEPGTRIKAIAGFFMVFRKSYWRQSKFQDHIYQKKTLHGMTVYEMFDSAFCRHAVQTGQPLRIIKGAYVFHGYRMLQKDYRDKKHLMI